MKRDRLSVNKSPKPKFDGVFLVQRRTPPKMIKGTPPPLGLLLLTLISSAALSHRESHIFNKKSTKKVTEIKNENFT